MELAGGFNWRFNRRFSRRFNRRFNRRFTTGGNPAPGRVESHSDANAALGSNPTDPTVGATGPSGRIPRIPLGCHWALGSNPTNPTRVPMGPRHLRQNKGLAGGETVVTKRRVTNAGDGYSGDFAGYGASHSRPTAHQMPRRAPNAPWSMAVSS